MITARAARIRGDHRTKGARMPHRAYSSAYDVLHELPTCAGGGGADHAGESQREAIAVRGWDDSDRGGETGRDAAPELAEDREWRLQYDLAVDLQSGCRSRSGRGGAVPRIEEVATY